MFKDLKFEKILPYQSEEDFFIFDFTDNNEELKKINISDSEEFSQYINKKLKQNKCKFGIGKYNEDRTIYSHSSLFSDKRSVHLGIDIWARAKTKVFCPFEGKAHSFDNNLSKGDYGPTLIIDHQNFYTLYGHLDKDSLKVKVGQKFKARDAIGRIGDYPENGDWPPHLHFQIIIDMLNKKGDFPGVCSQKEKKKFLKICPDPNLILRFKSSL